MPTLLLTIPGAPAAGANLLQLQRPAFPFVTDTFAADRADLNGTNTDSGMGGVARTWDASPGAFKVEGGFLRQGASNNSAVMGAGLNIGNGPVRCTMGLVGLPSGTLNLDIRKSQIDKGSAFSPCYRLRVNNAGVVELLRKSQPTGSYAVVSLGSHIMSAPGTFGIEIVERAFSIQVDGRTVETWYEGQTLLSGPFFEIVCSAGFSLYADYLRFDTPA